MEDFPEPLHSAAHSQVTRDAINEVHGTIDSGNQLHKEIDAYLQGGIENFKDEHLKGKEPYGITPEEDSGVAEEADRYLQSVNAYDNYAREQAEYTGDQADEYNKSIADMQAQFEENEDVLGDETEAFLRGDSDFAATALEKYLINLAKIRTRYKDSQGHASAYAQSKAERE